MLASDGTGAALLRCIAQLRTAEALELLDAGASSEWAAAYAAATGGVEVLRALLDRGTLPDARGPYGDMPILALAAGRGHRKAAELLLDAGADPDLATDGEFSGGGALSAAVRAGDLEMAQLLLARGANPNREESYHGETPLWELACRHTDVRHHRELVELLIARGADLEARNAGGLDGWKLSGRTPLACAVTEDDLEFARLLLGRGADPNALMDGGVRILERAEEGGSPQLVALLQQHGASVERELPSRGEVYEALVASGFEQAGEFYMLGARRTAPARMRPPFPSFYRGRTLTSHLARDLDGDGTPELAVILQRPGDRPASLILAVLRRGPKTWRMLHRRDSLSGNPVLGAALEAVPAGIGVHVFEARYQCDDEQPVYYELRWDARQQRISAPEGHQLHPLARNWDCGE